MEAVLLTVWYLVLLILILSAFWVVGTYLLFAYDRRLSQHGFLTPGYENRGELPHGGGAFLALLYETLCTAICILLFPLKWLRHRGGENHTILYHRPILLVHGFMHNQSGWTWLRRQLRMEKIGPVFSLNLEPRRASIEEFAKQVAERAEEIERLTGQTQLILIGHSMGGVVCSYFAEHLAPAGKVTDVITLGSPLDGSRPAVIPNRAACAAEMRPGSSLLQTLAKKRSENEERRYYHVASLFDALILPSQSAWSNVPEERLMILPGHGHIRLLFSKRVASQIVSWLKARIPQEQRAAVRATTSSPLTIEKGTASS